MNKKRLKFIIVIAIAIGIGSAATYFFRLYESRNNKEIKVSGNIEGDEVRLAFRVGGKIKELLVDEGSVVKAGDIVARLETDELTQARDQAKGQLEAVQHQYSLDKLDYERAENLFKEGAISQQDRDSAKTLAATDKANVDALTAALALSETQLGFAELASPINSYVLVKSGLAGEVMQVGSPVISVIDLNNLWVTAYINEKDLGRVKLNQQAYVTTDTFPGRKYKGSVSFISSQAEFTPKTIQTQEERVKLVYRIKVKVDNSSLELKPGMPADAYINAE